VVSGFETAVKNMAIGETKEVTLTPEEGYGERDPELIQLIPAGMIEEMENVKVGVTLVLQGKDGSKTPAQVVKIDDSGITLDLNHPLAGETLKFVITLVEVN
jgi:FKBP-type peptidyl-prolyl cis-trans isomerase 2